ncbi:MAG: hypothetical protein M3539_11820, partial [Acidobacteriota bacterium]|nr:hypothetical protein [Acidobacteriota bacterium]
MRRSFLLILMVAIALFFSVGLASAQFKIPKIPKPKPQPTPTETAQPEPANDPEPASQPAARNTSTGATPRAGGPYLVKPEPPMTTPQFLPETLEVQVEHWEYYWKIPNDNHNTSWVPR